MTDKLFPTADVIGASVGVLINEIGGVYAVCSHMAGESVFTHQLPRVGRECYAHLVKLYPWLEKVKEESEYVTKENYREWRKKWEDEYGLEVACPVMGEDGHERIDAMSELAEKVHPDRIIQIKI